MILLFCLYYFERFFVLCRGMYLCSVYVLGCCMMLMLFYYLMFCFVLIDLISFKY